MNWLRLGAHVSSAIAAGRPVVALETTLVTHGLPAPEGLRLALALEDCVRAGGACPATVGVLGGRAVVGLDAQELTRLAEAPGVAKLGLGNLAAHVASGGPGSTTVAGTLLLAHRAGLRVMATGGLGGVHRDVLESDDVSSDLTALQRFPVAVVCSGAKALLDLPRTRERLETLGVLVLGYGTERLPAFYRRDSLLPVDLACHDLASLATAVGAHLSLGPGSGVVVGNPIPVEHELPLELYEGALQQALAEARAGGVRGREVTPFLLERLRVLSAGRSLASNRELLLNNARTAAALACALEARA